MNITKEEKQEIIAKFGQSETDTGSPEVQIALMTARIRALTAHLQENKKDHHSRRGLFMLIGKRKGLMNYLQKKDIEKYRTLIQQLGIRG